MARTIFGQPAFDEMVGKEVFPGKDHTEVWLSTCAPAADAPLRLSRLLLFVLLTSRLMCVCLRLRSPGDPLFVQEEKTNTVRLASEK